MPAAVRLLFVLASVMPLTLCGSIIDNLLGRRDLEVITVTDMTPEGRQRPAPGPGHPEYYLIVNLGYHDRGGMIGRVREPPPDEAVRLISGELAKQGYLPATPDSPAPSLVLVFAWGTLNADFSVRGSIERSSDRRPPGQRNHKQILRFLGGEKLGLTDDHLEPAFSHAYGRWTLDRDARAIADIAGENFFIAVVTAYTIEGIRQQPLQHLWITRIACPSLGLSLPDVLPTMLALAGPNFGRETARPVWSRATEKYRPEVLLGEPRLVEYLKSAPLPVVNPSAGPAKPVAPKKPD